MTDDTQERELAERQRIVRQANQKDIFGMSAAVEASQQACMGFVPVLQQVVRQHQTTLGRICTYCGRADCTERHTVTPQRGRPSVPDLFSAFAARWEGV